jgi:N12 class adenine-specific DNA methylase
MSIGANIEYRIREEAKAEAIKEMEVKFDRAIQGAIRDLARELYQFYRNKGFDRDHDEDAERRYRHLYERLRREFGPQPARCHTAEEDGA